MFTGNELFFEALLGQNVEKNRLHRSRTREMSRRAFSGRGMSAFCTEAAYLLTGQFGKMNATSAPIFAKSAGVPAGDKSSLQANVFEFIRDQLKRP